VRQLVLLIMPILTLSDSTVFKFNRASQKWEEEASGNITFSAYGNGQAVVVSIGILSFSVQGEIKPKTSKAVVMEVTRKDTLIQPKALLILAIRFERERDVKKLFAMLKSINMKGRPYNSLGITPPPQFLALGNSEQINMRNLVLNLDPNYLRNGTVQRKLAADYNMTPEQFSQAIKFFQHWFLKRNNLPSPHRRSPRYDKGVSPFTSNCGYRGSPQRFSPRKPSPIRSPSHSWKLNSGRETDLQRWNKRPKTSMLYDTGMNYQQPSSRMLPPTHGYQLSGDHSVMTIMNPDGSMATSLQALGSLTIADSSCNSAFAPKLKTQLLRSTNLVIPKVRADPETKENTKNDKNNLRDQKGKPLYYGGRNPTSLSPSRFGNSNFRPAPLTEEIVNLYNKRVPPLKGDFRTIVKIWFDRHFPEDTTDVEIL